MVVSPQNKSLGRHYWYSSGMGSTDDESALTDCAIQDMMVRKKAWVADGIAEARAEPFALLALPFGHDKEGGKLQSRSVECAPPARPVGRSEIKPSHLFIDPQVSLLCAVHALNNSVQADPSLPAFTAPMLHEGARNAARVLGDPIFTLYFY